MSSSHGLQRYIIAFSIATLEGSFKDTVISVNSMRMVESYPTRDLSRLLGSVKWDKDPPLAWDALSRR